MSLITPFYEAAKWQQVAINLFYGWGFNFYRRENQLRTDDLLLRAKVSELLSAARADVVAAELAYRQEHLPPPTRENPLPDAQAVRTAKAIHAAAEALSGIESAIRTAPVPENDRMWQRHRSEAGTLQRLGETDTDIAALAAALSTQAREGGSAWVLEHLADIHAAVRELENVLRRRDALLSV